MRVIVQRSCRDKDDALSPAYLRKALVCLIRFSAKAVRLVDENVLVVLHALADKFFKLSAGLKASLPDLEISKDIWPRTRIVFIEQSWRRNDEGASGKLLRKHCSHVGFAQTDNVRKKYSAVFVQRPSRGGNGVFLVFQLFEAHRQINGIGFFAAAQLGLKILV